MQNRPIPKILVSKCLGFAKCRYNGVSIPDDLIESLKPFVSFVTVCPEVEIGLGVPRNPIRIISKKNKLCLYQPATGTDVTEKMRIFTSKFLDSLEDTDGFILKFKSPSCGIKGAKIYSEKEKSAPLGNTAGLFASEVIKRFSDYPTEDEGRLKNFKIREHFLTRLFAISGFRALKKTPSFGKLVDFHSKNKHLLMTYNQKELRELGKIVANHEKHPLIKVISLYESHFLNAFKKAPSHRSSINTLMHSLGYFSKKLSAGEKKYFLDTLKKFEEKKLPLSVPISIIRSYMVRFGEDYLSHQTFYEPYPEELVAITDSGKGRDIG